MRGLNNLRRQHTLCIDVCPFKTVVTSITPFYLAYSNYQKHRSITLNLHIHFVKSMVKEGRDEREASPDLPANLLLQTLLGTLSVVFSSQIYRPLFRFVLTFHRIEHQL